MRRLAILLVAALLPALWLATHTERSAPTAALPVVAEGATPTGPDDALLRPVLPPDASAVERRRVVTGSDSGAGVRERVTAGGTSAGAAVGPDHQEGSRLRIRLVDRATLEPVPWCAVRLAQDGRGPEECRSDAEGVLASRTAFAQGEVVLELLGDDAPREPSPVALSVARHEHGMSTRDEDVLVDVGPTYVVEFDSAPPFSFQDLTAWLCTEDAQSGGVSARLRAGDGMAWVRFRNLDLVDAPEALRVLEVRASDLRWRARAEIHSVIGRQHEVVLLLAECSASVSGRVEDERGEPVETSLFLSRVHEDGQAPATRPARSESDGGYSFAFVPVGAYALEIADPRYRPWSRRIELAPDESASITALLENASHGLVSGTLSSRTGTYALPLTIALESADGLLARSVTVASWDEENGRRLASFEFRGVPDGAYRLRLHAGGGYDWDPPDLSLQAPMSGLELVCLDDVPTRGVGFRVRDAATGATIPLFGAEIRERARDGTERLARVRSFATDAPLMRIVPDSARVEWAVRAPGYRPAYGDQSDFRGPSEADATWCADVRLQRGWGVELLVLEGAGAPGAPVEGARILLDGRAAGTTDERGIAHLEAAAAPGRVEVLHGDRRVRAGDVEPETGRLGPVITRATVLLSSS